MHISPGKKILSFFYPITIKSVSNTRHHKLTLQLFCNQYMLSTREAVYSFGTFYTPFRKSFSFLKKEIKSCDSFLLLGTGLGSALKILQTKHNVYPKSVLVDNDKDIIEMSMNYMNLNSRKNVSWKYADAYSYMQESPEKFDLIGVDVFRDTVMPKDFKQTAFFELCKNKLNDGGHCIFNMILNSTNEKTIICERLEQHFSHVKEITFRVNTFFICSC